MDDKKKSLAAIIVASKIKPKKESEDSESSDPKMIAVEELMEAIKSEDKKAVLESFKSLMSLCKEDSYEEED